MELPSPLPKTELKNIRSTIESIIADKRRHPSWTRIHFNMKYGEFAREKPALFNVAVTSDDADLALKLIDILGAEDGRTQEEKEIAMGNTIHERLNAK